MQEVVNILSKSVIEVSTFVRSELHCVKDSVAPVYEKFRSMMIPVDAEDANWLQDPGVQAVVKHFNKEPDELKESLEGPSVSFSDVFHCFSEFFSSQDLWLWIRGSFSGHVHEEKTDLYDGVDERNLYYIN